MPQVRELNVGLRAYVPAYEQVGAALPEPTVTNIAAARQATGLTWEPAAEPQYRCRAIGAGQEAFEPVPGLKYITRGEGGPVLGSLKQSYRLFSNAELFGLAETIGVAALQMRRQVRFLAGGEVAGGRRVFLLADLGVTQIPGDPSPYVRYMTLLSSHNGGGAVKVLGTNMRWYCTNALRAAELDAGANGAAFSFRHTSNLGKRLENCRDAITAALLQHDAVEARTADLLATRATPGAVSDYLNRFALANVVSKTDPHRPPAIGSGLTQHEDAVGRLGTQLRVIYESPTCEGIRDTAFGPFAAVVEYLDNVRPAVSPGSRFDRTMVNTERAKLTAYDLARRLF